MVARLCLLIFSMVFFAACKEAAKPTQSATAASESADAQASAQHLKIFAQLYPKADDVYWDSLDNTGFSATFFDGSFQNIAYFDAAGQFEYATSYLTVHNLPKDAQKILNTQYAKAVTAMVLRMEKNKRLTYLIELQTSTDYINLEFDDAGKLLKEKKVPLSHDEQKQQEEEGVEN
jgi:hypothetical protein